MIFKCQRCGRKLKNIERQKLGYGKTCALKAGVIDGLKRIHEIKPLIFSNPVTVDITYKDAGGADRTQFFMQNYPDERISDDTIRFIAPNAKEAYYGFLARDKLGKPKSGIGY